MENKKKAMMSTYSVAEVCATLEILQEKCCGSMQDMYLVTHEINDAILGLLNGEDNCKTSKSKNISKFTIFVPMFSDCHQILL